MAKPRLPQSTYYDAHAKAGAALYRARQPYLVKNAITGLCGFAFAMGVYAYTLRAVAQDNFEDVQVPPEPTKTPTPAQ